jgi:N-acyl-D-amino-acid deacylase
VAILNGRIERIGDLHDARATKKSTPPVVLAPGFIDVHTHDDTVVIRQPQMLPKLSQGVTTVIVGNCGISVAGEFEGNPPDPMNLLGSAAHSSIRVSAITARRSKRRTPLNVAALVGHTALRSNHLDDSAPPRRMKSRDARATAESLEPARWFIHRPGLCQRVQRLHR